MTGGSATLKAKPFSAVRSKAEPWNEERTRRCVVCAWSLRGYHTNMNNEKIANTLHQLADLLEFTGANPFRLRAYRIGGLII